MDIFFSTTLTVLMYLLIIGAVVRAYIILPKQLREVEKRLKKLENKEKK